jgi:hypothetical protein
MLSTRATLLAQSCYGTSQQKHDGNAEQIIIIIKGVKIVHRHKKKRCFIPQPDGI